MGTHVRNTATTTTWTIWESGDIWVLGEDGRITGTDIIGISATSSISEATIVIKGEIDLVALNGTADGTFIQAKSADITVTKTGHVSADVAIGYFAVDGAVTIANDGLLEGAVGISAQAAQDSAAITNAGQILAGTGIHALGAGAVIANAGTVTAEATGIEVVGAATDAHRLLARNASHIVNTGAITGLDQSIRADDVAVNIRNSGTLDGDLLLDGGNDIVNNRDGIIEGDIHAGAGNDIIRTVGGTLNGTIYGGFGSDVVTLASPATLYIENFNEGVDRVRIAATYTLGDFIENLTLLGGGDHAGAGNSLGNALRGNRGANGLSGLGGNDRLDGGRGDDVFVFKSGHGRDVIRDFEDGVDRIALGDIGSFSDLDGKISQSGDDVVIRFGGGDVLILRDMDAADLGAGDFQFLI